MCKNGGMAPSILRFEITWRLLVIFTTHLLYSHGKSTSVPTGQEARRTPEQDKTPWGNQKLLPLPDTELRFLSNPTP
jgi:hypothetical protein